MMGATRRALWFAVVVVAAAAVHTQEMPAQGRFVGTVKNVSATNLTLETDASTEVNVVVLPPTRIVRIAPGQTDLKQATPVQLQELKPGDRILVRGAASSDGRMVTASTIVLMKAEDVAQKHERERQDWERRGVGGLVSALDLAAGTVQLKTTGFMGSRAVLVRTTPETVVRRYAPDSPHFDDAVRATLADMKIGDQLRARGTRNSDGSEIAAEEVVSGTFRNIAGVVISSDPQANTLTVTDAATKKPVVVKFTNDSQVHRMPEQLAQGLAMMAKGQAGRSEGARDGGERPTMAAQGPSPTGGRTGFSRQGGSANLQQMLARMPAITVADLRKGEALMIVATAPAAGAPTVITLVAGVDPILRASPNEGAALLSPWNVGGGGGGGGEGGPPN